MQRPGSGSDRLFSRQALGRLLRATNLLHGAESDIRTADPRGSRLPLVQAREKIDAAQNELRDAIEAIKVEAK